MYTLSLHDALPIYNASGGNPLLLRALVLGHGASPPEESETEEVARSIVVDLLYGTLRQWRAFMLRTSIPEAFDVADRKSTRLNSSHVAISYAVFCLKKKNTKQTSPQKDW